MHGSSQFSDLEPVAKAHRYAQCAATTVLVKHVVDSMAAGDSFNAGFLASRIVGQTIAQPVHAASVVATKVIQHRGALVTGL